MKKVIADTNALLAMAEFKIDLLQELERVCDFKQELYVLEGTLRELHQIQLQQKGKTRRWAKLVQDILLAKKVPALPGKGYVDDLLVGHSQRGDLVLTQDLELKKRLKRPYLTIKQKKMITIVD